jgi:NAD-dependent deacetylase
MAMHDNAIAAARLLLQDAAHVVVFTGAGVSAESGIPTFRDALTGLWAQFNPEELASAAGFAADPARVWSWYAWRREQLKACSPNAAHRAIAAYQQAQQPQKQVDVITQNVDGLHQAAGAERVMELHGRITRSACFAGCSAVVHDPAMLPPGSPPPCKRCGGSMRPDMVWFGEMLPEATLQAAQRAAMQCDVIIVAGTSSLVYPAAELPMSVKRGGGKVIVVNPNRTPLDDVADAVLRGRAGEILPILLAV